MKTPHNAPEPPKEAAPATSCLFCSKPIQNRRPGALYCSLNCRAQANNLKWLLKKAAGGKGFSASKTPLVSEEAKKGQTSD